MRSWILWIVLGGSIPSAAAPAERVEEVRNAHLGWVDALNRQDVAYMRFHSLPEISMFNVGDPLQKEFDDADWEAMRAQARQAATQQRRVSHEIEEIKLYGDVALITGYASTARRHAPADHLRLGPRRWPLEADASPRLPASIGRYPR